MGASCVVCFFNFTQKSINFGIYKVSPLNCLFWVALFLECVYRNVITCEWATSFQMFCNVQKHNNIHCIQNNVCVCTFSRRLPVNGNYKIDNKIDVNENFVHQIDHRQGSPWIPMAVHTHALYRALLHVSADEKTSSSVLSVSYFVQLVSSRRCFCYFIET